jgi:hypothetical protein
MAKAFPKTLYVKAEKDGGVEYFSSDASAAALVEMGQTIKVATYQLVEVQDAQGVAEFKKSRTR